MSENHWSDVVVKVAGAVGAGGLLTQLFRGFFQSRAAQRMREKAALASEQNELEGLRRSLAEREKAQLERERELNESLKRQMAWYEAEVAKMRVLLDENQARLQKSAEDRLQLHATNEQLRAEIKRLNEELEELRARLAEREATST